ncbi:hypothetical protein B0H13DRAFT_1860221 [Mycena leptocephala]|nr:hypothetical protein B0H13DRAFT_1860221 [Mycena leptocephala]
MECWEGKGGTISYQEGGSSSLQARTGETTQRASEPAMRPSAAELLNHERVRFTSKAQNLLIREFELKERESAINDALQNKNAEIQSFQSKIQAQLQITGSEAIKSAVKRREREISVLQWIAPISSHDGE